MNGMTGMNGMNGMHGMNGMYGTNKRDDRRTPLERLRSVALDHLRLPDAVVDSAEGMLMRSTATKDAAAIAGAVYRAACEERDGFGRRKIQVADAFGVTVDAMCGAIPTLETSFVVKVHPCDVEYEAIRILMAGGRRRGLTESERFKVRMASLRHALASGRDRLSGKKVATQALEAAKAVCDELRLDEEPSSASRKRKTTEPLGGDLKDACRRSTA